MKRMMLIPATAALALLGACEARIGNDAPAVDANATAEGKAEEGRLTVSAPGFNMSMSIPSDHAQVDDNGEMIYPGATIDGIHVQGGRSGGDDQVELRFTSPDAGDRILAWYRDPARNADFTVASVTQEGNAQIVTGTVDGGEPFALRISPRAEGGSEGRLVLTDRHN